MCSLYFDSSNIFKVNAALITKAIIDCIKWQETENDFFIALHQKNPGLNVLIRKYALP